MILRPSVLAFFAVFLFMVSACGGKSGDIYIISDEAVIATPYEQVVAGEWDGGRTVVSIRGSELHGELLEWRDGRINPSVHYLALQYNYYHGNKHGWQIAIRQSMVTKSAIAAVSEICPVVLHARQPVYYHLTVMYYEHGVPVTMLTPPVGLLCSPDDALAVADDMVNYPSKYHHVGHIKLKMPAPNLNLSNVTRQ